MLALGVLSVSFATPMAPSLVTPMLAPSLMTTRATAPAIMNGAFLALDAVAPAVESYVCAVK